MPLFPQSNFVNAIQSIFNPGSALNKIFGIINPGAFKPLTPSIVPVPSVPINPKDDVLEPSSPEPSAPEPSAPEPSSPTLPGDDRLDDFTDYNFLEYLEGLFASAGAENETNRLYNSAQAALNREFQHNESQLQRDWYEAMSSSAYQRAMKDMKAAGLNPILAYSQGGAASSGTGVPTGSAASYNVGSGDTLSNILMAVSDLVSSLSGASASKIDKMFKIFKMAGG